MQHQQRYDWTGESVRRRQRIRRWISFAIILTVIAGTTVVMGGSLLV